jgi:hypothetical protein
MALLDWILVAFGVAVALAGGWIQLNPERVVSGSQRNPGWQLDARTLSQIRLLGSCFLSMGTFFALQMTIDLVRLPWWTGTLSGIAAAVVAVTMVRARVRRQRFSPRDFSQQTSPQKTLELR